MACEGRSKAKTMPEQGVNTSSSTMARQHWQLSASRNSANNHDGSSKAATRNAHLATRPPSRRLSHRQFSTDTRDGDVSFLNNLSQVQHPKQYCKGVSECVGASHTPPRTPNEGRGTRTYVNETRISFAYHSILTYTVVAARVVRSKDQS